MGIGFLMDEDDWCSLPNEFPVSSTGIIPDLCTTIECAMCTVPSGPGMFLVHGHPILGYIIPLILSALSVLLLPVLEHCIYLLIGLHCALCDCV